MALVQKLQGHVTYKKDDMFGSQRKKQEGEQRHEYEVANKYVFKCRLKVDSDDDDVINDGKLFHARAAATGKARSPIVLRRVTDGTSTAVDELERRLRLVPTSAARLMLSARYTGAVPLKPCPHCRIRRQSPFSATVALFCDSVDRA